MASNFKPRKIQHYIPEKTRPSAVDTNDIVKRLERLENLSVGSGLHKSDTPTNTHLSLVDFVHDMEHGYAAEAITADATLLFDVTLSKQDRSGSYTPPDNTYAFAEEVRGGMTVQARNPWLQTFDDGDMVWLWRYPREDQEWLIMPAVPSVVTGTERVWVGITGPSSSTSTSILDVTLTSTNAIDDPDDYWTIASNTLTCVKAGYWKIESSQLFAADPNAATVDVSGDAETVTLNEAYVGFNSAYYLDTGAGFSLAGNGVQGWVGGPTSSGVGCTLNNQWIRNGGFSVGDELKLKVWMQPYNGVAPGWGGSHGSIILTRFEAP